MLYNKIINPETGRYVNINGIIGKKVINRYLLQIGGENNSDKLMDLLYRQSIEKEQVDDDDIYILLNNIENNDDLYNSIYKINKILRHKKGGALRLFIDNIYRFQELPQMVKDLKPCKYHVDTKTKCKRANLLHLESHKFLHPATLIAQSLILLNS